MNFTRRKFLSSTTGIALGCSLTPTLPFSLLSSGCDHGDRSSQFPLLKKSEKQLFADDLLIAKIQDIKRKVHPATKLEHPVLEADMPWELGEEYSGKKDRRIYIYGTVLRDPGTGTFRMWYSRYKSVYYATSDDGINWNRPVIGQLGENNMIQLFEFHSPSFIRDEWDPDPAKRYKAIGSVKGGISETEMNELKKKFKSAEVYTGSSAYWAAYSADGLRWTKYPKPALFSSDTITLSQDLKTGEYLAFHKIGSDPRVKGRQVFLSVSKDMENWSEPEPVMVTDETDHEQARLLERGTHSEFYNMSAFPYGSQWLGLVTHFRRTGEPLVKKGPFQSNSEGPIDVQLVHSRDGRKWDRCSDRSPVIPLGPYPYDAGSILGVCNSPVIVGDEMWMYYTAMTTTHGGYLPEKILSIARAAWRLDGMVSLNSSDSEGIIETLPFIPEGDKLFVNTDVAIGGLKVELLDKHGKVKKGYDKDSCKVITTNKIKQQVQWNESEILPSGKPLSLRFYLERGDLYSYLIE